jgi:hypothetical protein
VQLLLLLPMAAYQLHHPLLLHCRLCCLLLWLLLPLLLPDVSAVLDVPCLLRWRWWLQWQCPAHGTAPQTPAMQQLRVDTVLNWDDLNHLRW